MTEDNRSASTPAAPAAPASPAAPADESDLKDRLVQTRVPRDLERRVKGEARRRRLSVSQFVRTLLEDTLNLVDDVLENVDDIVADSVDFADNVRQDAQSLARTASREGRRVADAVRGRLDERDERNARSERKNERNPRDDRNRQDHREGSRGESRPDHAGTQAPAEGLEHIVAWNSVILNRTLRCAQCDSPLVRGERAHLGVNEDGGPPVCLCERCVETLSQEGE